MFGFGKKKAAIEVFATALVTDFKNRFPPGTERELGSKKLKPAAELGKAVGHLERRAVAFQLEQRLGVYGKATLINSIKWQMKELAYSEEFIEVTTTNLAQVLGKARSKG